MQTLQAGYRGLSLLLMINRDRVIYIAAIFAALYLGVVLGTLMFGVIGQPTLG